MNDVMGTIRNMVWNLTHRIRVVDVIDILIVAIIIYELLLLTRHTRGSALLKGLFLLLIIAFLSNLLGLVSLNWLLNAILQNGAIVLVVLFQPEFRKALAASKGFCLDHYAQVMKAAPQHLSGKELNELIETITTIEMENLTRVEKDLEWFTLKFDYRNRDKPWGASQDAVERSVNKMRGGAV